MSKVVKSSFAYKNAACRLVGTQAAADPMSTFGYLSSKLVNGISVMALENHSPVSRVAIAAKAGSRYETSDNRGVSHMLRAMAGLRTDDTTAVTITRHLQQLGAKLRCTTTRDAVIYTLECLRDVRSEALQYLKEVAVQPLFRHWEVQENCWRLSQDLAVLQTKPELMLIECLHEAAYRAGLSHSLFTPEYMIGNHTPEMLSNYVKQHFTTGNMSVSGYGMDQESVTAFANTLPVESGPMKSDAAAYRGGELHRDTGGDFAHVAVCVESSGFKNVKDCFSLLVLEQILGTGARTKYGCGLGSRLGAAAAKVSPDSLFSVGSVNMLYEDSGLFGFALCAPANKAGELAKALADEMKMLMGGKLSDADVALGKSKIKAEMMCSDEKPLTVVEDLATYPLTVQETLSLPEVMKHIDQVTLKDVSAVSKKVLGGKPSMAAVGKVSGLPYLDQL